MSHPQGWSSLNTILALKGLTQHQLKCDEQKPICSQCQKANRECKPSPGVIFRHQQNASLNSEGDGSLDRFYGYKETFSKENTWVDVPEQLTFVHISDPYSIGSDQDIDSPFLSSTATERKSPSAASTGFDRAVRFGDLDSHGLDALSAVASSHARPLSSGRDGFSVSQQPLQVSTRRRSTSAQNLDYVLNQASPDSPQASADLQLKLITSPTAVSSRPRPAHGQGYVSEVLYPKDDDISYLLRHFSKGPGHWMDLFDLGRFFETDVPIKAATCPLLLYSAVALAAKSLGRLSPLCDTLRNTGSSNSVWLHRARTYYDKAISYLREALAAETYSSQFSSGSDRPDRRWSGASGDLEPPHRRGLLPRTDSDELVGTTAILCVYEFLDASGEEWSRHLDGAKSLFDIAKDSVLAMPAEVGSTFGGSTWHPSTNSRLAIFWNIARQDMLDAFINSTASRLDTSDIRMWRSVGLNIADSGYIVPSNDPERFAPMQDDMVCNALVWLVMQIVNFTAVARVVEASSPQTAIPRHPLQDSREGLLSQLDTWFRGLPDSFRPITSSWYDGRGGGKGTKRLNIPKKWFARSMCASTMQWYHFGRLQLLRHRPTSCSPDTPDAELVNNEQTLRDSFEHAREIISIGLAQTDEGVLVHSVQPLYAAGQALRQWNPGGAEVDEELESVRETMVEHLQAIERQTGWATEYRTRQLLEQWNSSTDWRQN